MSSEIQGFSEVDLLSAQFGDDGRIGVDRREDKETIEKTDRAAPEIISDTPRSTASDLDGKLIEPIAAETTPEEFFEQLSADEKEQLQQELAQIDELAAENEETQLFTPKEMNFIMKLKEIIAKAFDQQNRLNERDRVNLEKLKVEYKDAIKKEADFLRKMGAAGLIIAIGAMAVFGCQFARPGNQGVAKICEFTSQHLSKGFGDIVQQRYNARGKEESGRGALAMNQLNNEQQKKQSEGNMGDRLSNAYKEALDLEKSASRAG